MSERPKTSSETGFSRERISIPRERILAHFLDREISEQMTFIKEPAGKNRLAFTGDFYFANIGAEDNPLILELRFEPTALTPQDVNPNFQADLLDNQVRIALLMTNERYQNDLEQMGREILNQVEKREIEFDAVVAPDSLGSKLSQEIARLRSAEGKPVYLTSIQKGKAGLDKKGNLKVGSPKPWISEESGVEVNSGTSHAGSRQKLYLDPKIAEEMARRKQKVLLVDDARLTEGTINSAVALLKQFNLEVAGIATVLNEGSPVKEIDSIPFVWLTKLPLFARTKDGLEPIPGTFDGLEHFYCPSGKTIFKA